MGAGRFGLRRVLLVDVHEQEHGGGLFCCLAENRVFVVEDLEDLDGLTWRSLDVSEPRWRDFGSVGHVWRGAEADFADPFERGCIHQSNVVRSLSRAEQAELVELLAAS